MSSKYSSEAPPASRDHSVSRRFGLIFSSVEDNDNTKEDSPTQQGTITFCDDGTTDKANAIGVNTTQSADSDVELKSS